MIISNEEILTEFRKLVTEERKITLRILHLINEVEKRRLFAEAGYPSPFEWLTREFGYSAAAAQRRIDSARLLRAVPTAASDIQSGELNLTNVAKVQVVIRHEEKRTGKMTPQAKADILNLVKAKTSREAEEMLAAKFPEAVKKPESIKFVNEEEVRVQVTLTKAQLRKLERVREVASHSHTGASLSDLIEVIADAYLEKRDPRINEIKPRISGAGSTNASDRATTSNVKRQPLKPSVRNEVLRSTNATCSFEDPQTGKVCGSSYRVEIDHLKPIAAGGTNSRDNLRPLCRAHNQLMAAEVLGKHVMEPFRKS